MVSARRLSWSVAVSGPPQPSGLICEKYYACGIDDDDGGDGDMYAYLPGSTWYACVQAIIISTYAKRGR